MEWILVAAGGAAGAVARAIVGAWAARRWGERFPWGTLLVNVSGALIIGALAARALVPAGVEPGWREAWLLLAIGGLGAYTTVSAFAWQTLELLRARGGRWAAINVAASGGLCLAAAAFGHWLAS